MCTFARLCFLVFVVVALWGCHPSSSSQRSQTAVSPGFYADSLRTLGRGIRLIKENKEKLALPPLDSVFLLPVADDSGIAVRSDGSGIASSSVVFDNSSSSGLSSA